MAVKFQDYYETLGVGRDATAEQIRKAYRTLARKHHPDVNQGDKSSEEKFKRINEAYEVLKDPEKRQRYDQLGANWKAGQEFRPPPGFTGRSANFGPGGFGGTGFSDFFESLFGAAGAQAFGGPGRGARPTGFGGVNMGGFEAGPGAFSGDVESEIEVPVDKIVTGGQMSVRISLDGGAPRSYDIRIPKGIAEGKKIRLAGQGQAGGDLFLTVKYARDGRYAVEGSDLIVDARVTPWEAALGGKVPVETPEGRLNVTLPAGSSSGRRLRVPGHGLPTGEGAMRGDLLVRVMVCVPTTLTKAEEELLRKLAEESTFNPRA